MIKDSNTAMTRTIIIINNAKGCIINKCWVFSCESKPKLLRLKFKWDENSQFTSLVYEEFQSAKMLDSYITKLIILKAKVAFVSKSTRRNLIV